MGLAHRASIAATLLARGWSAATPGAILAGISTPAAWSWRGALSDLGAAEPPAESEAPAILCIGETVALAQALAVPAPAEPLALRQAQGERNTTVRSW
jgi:siroheme synthase